MPKSYRLRQLLYSVILAVANVPPPAVMPNLRLLWHSDELWTVSTVHYRFIENQIILYQNEIIINVMLAKYRVRSRPKASQEARLD